MIHWEEHSLTIAGLRSDSSSTTALQVDTLTRPSHLPPAVRWLPFRGPWLPHSQPTWFARVFSIPRCTTVYLTPSQPGKARYSSGHGGQGQACNVIRTQQI